MKLPSGLRPDEGVAAGAALCVWLVVRDVVVAFHARRSIGANRGAVDVVASSAVGVTGALWAVWDAVKARQTGALVAARAAGCRRHRASVGFVARSAVLVAFGARRLDLLVAAGAGDWALERVGRSLVAGLAARVIRDAFGQLNLLPVAVCAEDTLFDSAQVEAMRLVTVRATRLRGVEGAIGTRLVVAARALKGDLRCAPGVRVMTGNAFTLVLDHVRRRHVLVASLAGPVACSANGVGLMAAAAIPVFSRGVLGEDSLPLVTAFTARRARGGKRMGLVAVHAGIVPTREDRCLGDPGLLVGMTLHACRGFRCELVPAVAIRAGSAELGPSVFHSERFVAIGAFCSGLARWLVWVVAVRAGDLIVHRQAGVGGRIERPVTARAVPGAVRLGVELERVAGEALGDLAFLVEVGVRGLLDVAGSTDCDVDLFEVRPGRVMAAVTFKRVVDDVLRMPGRKTYRRASRPRPRDWGRPRAAPSLSGRLLS